MTRQWGKKDEVDLSEAQVNGILSSAKQGPLDIYLVLRLLADCGLRINEVVGYAWKTATFSCSSKGPLPGIQIEDIQWDRGTVWVIGKGGPKGGRIPREEVPLPNDLLDPLKQLVGRRAKGRLFAMSDNRVRRHLSIHAKLAGIQDWKRVHVHRLRHYFITRVARVTKDPIAARDLARHLHLSTTNRYIAQYSLQDKKRIMDQVLAS